MWAKLERRGTALQRVPFATSIVLCWAIVQPLSHFTPRAVIPIAHRLSRPRQIFTRQGVVREVKKTEVYR